MSDFFMSWTFIALMAALLCFLLLLIPGLVVLAVWLNHRRDRHEKGGR